jgi:ribosomal protein S18 acetylase RimI-like enzyme
MKWMINPPIEDHEVPDLRESVGWSRRDGDFPVLLERCTFWAGGRNANDRLVAFGYMTGMGLEHGYLEDIIVHPNFQGMGLGKQLVSLLVAEAHQRGIDIVTTTFHVSNKSFYEKCGAQVGYGGLWVKE